ISSKVDAAFIKQLVSIVGKEECSTSASVIEQHAKDEGSHSPKNPDVVVFVKSTEQVSLLSFCTKSMLLMKMHDFSHIVKLAAINYARKQAAIIGRRPQLSSFFIVVY